MTISHPYLCYATNVQKLERKTRSSIENERQICVVTNSLIDRTKKFERRMLTMIIIMIINIFFCALVGTSHFGAVNPFNGGKTDFKDWM